MLEPEFRAQQTDTPPLNHVFNPLLIFHFVASFIKWPRLAFELVISLPQPPK